MIEVFGNRMEITNPGKPLIDVFRFIDHTPISRNEKLASLMRRMTIWRNEVADSHSIPNHNLCHLRHTECRRYVGDETH